MIQEVKIKILRLNTGEDIIGECLIDEENSCVNIENPMRVMLRRMTNAGKTMLVMSPWLPLEIIDDNFATINYMDIITVIDPKDSFIEYYTTMVEEFEARMELEEKMTQQELEEDEVDDEYHEESMQEILKAMKDSKKETYTDGLQ